MLLVYVIYLDQLHNILKFVSISLLFGILGRRFSFFNFFVVYLFFFFFF
jgi:hypothetical protein